MKLKILLASFLLQFGTNAFAVPDVTTAAVPKNLHVYDSTGKTYVDHVQGVCTTVRYHISPSHVKYDAIVSILLSAQMSNKKVVIRYNGCVNSGSQGELIGVYLVE